MTGVLDRIPFVELGGGAAALAVLFAVVVGAVAVADLMWPRRAAARARAEVRSGRCDDDGRDAS